jgi:deazaflavin-dependent oxidoreductase (nitroreductase family)
MWYNPFVKQLLHSPLHGLVDNSVMLVFFNGRKSGKPYTVPVNYVRDGEDLWAISYRQRTWWRNLRGQATISVCVQGHEQRGRAEVIERDEEVAAALLAYLRKVPQFARYFSVQLDPDGEPNHDDVARAAQGRVMVRIRPAAVPVAA